MTNFIKGTTGDWEVVVGLEIHAQILSETKLFSGAATQYGAEPNSQVSLIDAGMPGMLPVINRECIRQAVKTGVALGAKINRVSVFDRKNYFYPDLPQGYQISQYSDPIVGEGTFKFPVTDRECVVGIERIHLEQDAGKSIHDQDLTRSLIDLNRAGVALMEIVLRPDLHSGEESAACLRALRTVLRFIGTCDGNMQEGSLRCDANVSVRRPGEELGTRCEIKNVNSFKFLQQAIDYEALRQIEILEDGGVIRQETRLFDADVGETRTMRSKENAHDYRYFPDPDLLPLELTDDFIAEISKSVPELPNAKRDRFISEYHISVDDANFLITEPEISDFYETLAEGRDSKLAASWLMNELFGALYKKGLILSESPVDADTLGELIDLISDGTISGRTAKDVFGKMFSTGQKPEKIIDELGLRQVSDETELAEMVDAILKKHDDKVQEYRSGKTKLLGFFIGQVMKQTKGTANPQIVNKIMRDKL